MAGHQKERKDGVDVDESIEKRESNYETNDDHDDHDQGPAHLVSKAKGGKWERAALTSRPVYLASSNAVDGPKLAERERLIEPGQCLTHTHTGPASEILLSGRSRGRFVCPARQQLRLWIVCRRDSSRYCSQL